MMDTFHIWKVFCNRLDAISLKAVNYRVGLYQASIEEKLSIMKNKAGIIPIQCSGRYNTISSQFCTDCNNWFPNTEYLTHDVACNKLLCFDCLGNGKCSDCD